jgi:hypothetical protein
MATANNTAQQQRRQRMARGAGWFNRMVLRVSFEWLQIIAQRGSHWLLALCRIDVIAFTIEDATPRVSWLGNRFATINDDHSIDRCDS